MNQALSEMPSGATSTPLISGELCGVIHPHVLLCSMPNTTKMRPAADSSTLSRSMRMLWRGVRSVMNRAVSTTPAMMTTSATNTYRQLR